jgi:hypothetical protein
MYPFESLHTEKRVASTFLLPNLGQMKRGWVAGLAALLMTTPAQAAAPSCHLPGGRTIATGRIAKLIALPTPSGSVLYACIRRSGRKVYLDDGYANPRVAGRWVAWQRPGRPGKWRIAVHDLRGGDERLVDGHVAAESLLLTARGTIVWAQQQDAGGDTPLYSNDMVSGGRLLDGGAVDPKSPRLAGRRVSWLSDGEQRSAVVR